MITSGADATQREGSYVIGSTYMELLTEGNSMAVAIGIDGTAYDTCGKRMAHAEVVVPTCFDGTFDELCIGCAKECLVAHAEGLAHGCIEQ